MVRKKKDKEESKKFELGIEMKNFGPITSGKIDVKPMTIFIGPNNSGKSYAAILIHALLDAYNSSSRQFLYNYPLELLMATRDNTPNKILQNQLKSLYSALFLNTIQSLYSRKLTDLIKVECNSIVILIKLKNFEICLASEKNILEVLYFYPKDFSPGCTTQACGFRDAYEDFTDMDAVVIGVSGDAVESHKKFVEDYLLPFTLLSDRDGVVRKLYGATKVFGLLPGRYTLIIDKGGVVRYMFTSETNMGKHVEEAVRILRELS